MSLARRISVLLSPLLCVVLLSCDTTPTGPPGFLGNVLEASVNGTKYTFLVDSDNLVYDSAATYSTVPGATSSGNVTRSITVFFRSDINAGSFPRVLDSDDINIVYVEITSGVALNYDCSTHRDDCSLTLTSSGSGVVGGTFSAHLTSRADTTRHVEITDGRFSVRIQ